jgi:hypothetical protein
MAISDGLARDQAMAHVERCSTCAERAAGYARIQRELQRWLFRFDCPGAHTLGEFELNLLDSEMRIVVGAHANECTECASELQSLRTFLATPIQLPDSPVAQARRLVASLFSGSPGLGYAGLRGGPSSTARVYRVEDVTVTVGPGLGRGTWAGLVVAGTSSLDTLDGLGVRLWPSRGEAFSTSLDALGNFEFGNTTPGAYVLEIDLPGRRVVIVEELQLD